MFERFTDRARRVVVLAQEEARTRGGHYVETQDVLTALLVDGDGPAADVLSLAGFTPESLRSQLAAGLPVAHTGAYTPFSLSGKKALEYALREALQLGHNYVGAEHILLGLIREGEGMAAQLLAKGPGLDVLRHALIERITGEMPATTTTGEVDWVSELTLEGQVKELVQHVCLIEGEVISIGQLLRSRETEFRPALSWRLKLDELEERVAALESSNEKFGTGTPT